MRVQDHCAMLPQALALPFKIVPSQMVQQQTPFLAIVDPKHVTRRRVLSVTPPSVVAVAVDQLQGRLVTPEHRLGCVHRSVVES